MPMRRIAGVARDHVASEAAGAVAGPAIRLPAMPILVLRDRPAGKDVAIEGAGMRMTAPGMAAAAGDVAVPTVAAGVIVPMVVATTVGVVITAIVAMAVTATVVMPIVVIFAAAVAMNIAVVIAAFVVTPKLKEALSGVAFAVPLPMGPKHLLGFAFIAIFQFEPLAWMVTFCASLFRVAYCCTRVPLLVEPPATSIDLPVAEIGARL